MLARMYYDLGDDRKFEDATAQAEKRWPDDPDVQLNLSILRLMHGEAASAAQHARRSFDADRRRQVALMILRDADLRAGRSDAALARYKSSYAELFVQGKPRVDGSNYWIAIDLAVVAKMQGNSEMAGALLDGAERAIQTVPRLGDRGYWISDVQIHALRGEMARALAALREAERAGWRGPRWRYSRDFDLSLASLRDAPEFKAVFADIERDLAQQRAELAQRPKDAPLLSEVASR
jgi:tetratricopeptide (TPR) repeat protein